MAIKFEDEKGETGMPQPKKEIGGKTYVAEEPAPDAAAPASDLPFGKPVRAEKKPKPKR